MKKLFFAATALVLATPAMAATYVIPAKVATDASACPKVAIVASEPGSTISAARLPKTQGNYADINLKTGKAKVGRCVIKISGFANAIGAPWGATLTGDDNANVLTGIGDNKKGAASDWVLGNGGDDTISVVASSAAVSGGAGKDNFLVPADLKFNIGKKTYTQPIVEDLAAGETVTRR